MENNDFLENLSNLLPNANINSKHTKVVYLNEYIKRDDIGFYSKSKESSVNGEIVTETTLYLKKYHCQHVCLGKANWGMELTEPVTTNDKKLKKLIKRLEYFIVCKDCVKECEYCGRLTSRISGEKINGTWCCYECKREIERAELWQKIKNFMGGTW
jgi:hypothetical protein